MKKIRKRLMMIVAVLLSMVLLTSSVVSTTLAKYVITKKADTTVTLKQYGLIITLDVDTSFAEVSTTKKGDSVSVTYSGVYLKPGDSYPNVITASIKTESGKTLAAKSTAYISIDVTDCSDDKFKVPADNFSSLLEPGKDKVYFPLGVCVAGNTTDYVLTPYTAYDYDATNTALVETAIENAIGDKILALAKAPSNVSSESYTRTDGVGTVKATLAASKSIALNNIGIGFVWPKEYGEASAHYDEIGTWVSKDRPAFNITYTIKVEQST